MVGQVAQQGLGDAGVLVLTQDVRDVGEELAEQRGPLAEDGPDGIDRVAGSLGSYPCGVPVVGRPIDAQCGHPPIEGAPRSTDEIGEHQLGRPVGLIQESGCGHGGDEIVEDEPLDESDPDAIGERQPVGV